MTLWSMGFDKGCQMRTSRLASSRQGSFIQTCSNSGADPGSGEGHGPIAPMVQNFCQQTAASWHRSTRSNLLAKDARRNDKVR